MNSDPVLIYDGDCGFCTWTVNFVLAHERRGELRFAPLSGPFAAGIIADRPDLRELDSVFWVEFDESGEPTTILTRSAAAIKTLRYIGGWWSLWSIARVIPLPIRDWIYDLVARNRRRMKDPSRCLTIPPGFRQRFIDVD